MNCKKSFTNTLVQFILISLCIPLLTFAQTKEVTWNYPIRPGTEEWKQLNSFSERLNAFNIPESILVKMTTENLVKTCLNYPWWILITSRDDNQSGYEYLKSVFNGFRELEIRNDAGAELLKIYSKMEPSKILECKTFIDKGSFSYQFIFIEIILSQPNIFQNLTKHDLTKLLEVAISVFGYKNNPAINYSLLSLSSTVLILGRILEKNQNKEFLEIKDVFFKCDRFIKGGITDDKEMLIRIKSMAENYYKSLLP